MESYARYALVVSGTIWGGLVSFLRDVVIPTPAAWVPALLTILMFLQNLAIQSDLNRLGGYIAKIEAEFGLPDGLGWETSLRKKEYRFAHNDWRLAFWIVLILVNILGAFAFPEFHARRTP
jgi:hypothetical protein